MSARVSGLWPPLTLKHPTSWARESKPSETGIRPVLITPVPPTLHATRRRTGWALVPVPASILLSTQPASVAPQTGPVPQILNSFKFNTSPFWISRGLWNPLLTIWHPLDDRRPWAEPWPVCSTCFPSGDAGCTAA